MLLLQHLFVRHSEKIPQKERWTMKEYKPEIKEMKDTPEEQEYELTICHMPPEELDKICKDKGIKDPSWSVDRR